MIDTSVTVLGQEYDIEFVDGIDMGSDDGMCNSYSKVISIRKQEDLFSDDSCASDNDRNLRLREVIRHELVHAFLYESGLECYNEDEVLVDWIARQLDKINVAIDEVFRTI